MAQFEKKKSEEAVKTLEPKEDLRAPPLRTPEARSDISLHECTQKGLRESDQGCFTHAFPKCLAPVELSNEPECIELQFPGL